MSFRINTNVAAMNALRNVSQTGSMFNSAISKLSTGLRINNASDDPAGLIISENFRAQIASMDQAIRNNQDAINFAKTAEGALDEVNRLLRDARSLAVASGNSGTLSSDQLQANQSQLNSIISSVTRVAQTTQFGNKKLLDGSAGVVGSVTNGTNFSAISLSGQFNGAALTTNASVTVTVTTAADQATVASQTFSFGTSTVSAGSFTVNGTTFTTAATDTVNDVVNRINAATGQTGVRADYTTGGAVTLTNVNYGSSYRVDLADANGVLLAAAGSSSDTGTDAAANVIIDTNGSTAGGLVTVAFTGGRYGQSALKLSDNDGNSITLTTAGNTAGTALAGQLSVGSASFQIGANAGQTTTLSLGNFSASQLGSGVVSGKNLSNIDITTTSGAAEALSVIDAAIAEVSRSRGNLGSFQRNAVESNIRALGISKENLAASESAIRDVDVAAEMTNFTKLQILQQSGLAVLAQANAAPQSVLSLLR
ncbi:MAG TPA: flagellin [Fimbriimonadaceae bacterium]|nr:flagellin [Fimbriimonadaceae bacterium]